MCAKSLHKTIEKSYKRLGLDPGYDETNSTFSVRIPISGVGDVSQYIQRSINKGMIRTYLPDIVVEERRQEINKAISDLNSRSTFGFYNMDNAGKVHYRFNFMTDSESMVSAKMVQEYILIGFEAIRYFHNNVYMGCHEADSEPLVVENTKENVIEYAPSMFN